MFYAPGGLAGYIGDTTSLLGDGFAMATTDTGQYVGSGDVNEAANFICKAN